MKNNQIVANTVRQSGVGGQCQSQRQHEVGLWTNKGCLKCGMRGTVRHGMPVGILEGNYVGKNL